MAKQESSEGKIEDGYQNTVEEKEQARRLIQNQPGSEYLLAVLELA